MLVEFTLSNFRSFKERFTLSLEATQDDWLESDNVSALSKTRLLKSAAIYGPNAGGKSNILSAMEFYRNFIIRSSTETQVEEKIAVQPFKLSVASEEKPTLLEAVFIIDEVRYRYGFEVTPKEIVKEWLFSVSDSKRESTLYTREGSHIRVGQKFREGRGLEPRTRPNALFLSVCAQFNGEEAGKLLKWVKQFRCISGLDDKQYLTFTVERLKEPEWHEKIINFARRADLGLEDVQVRDLSAEERSKTIPKIFPKALQEFLISEGTAFAVTSFHTLFDSSRKPKGRVQLDFAGDESAGTQKFVALSGPLLHTLSLGSILVVDELEARLHPLLTKALVKLFNSSANTKNAQLIFATHDEGLLDPTNIRRDQIWFVEKNRYGESKLYSLSEFAVRKEAKFPREYLVGSFGAIPKVSLDEQECNIENSGRK